MGQEAASEEGGTHKPDKDTAPPVSEKIGRAEMLGTEGVPPAKSRDRADAVAWS